MISDAQRRFCGDGILDFDLKAANFTPVQVRSGQQAPSAPCLQLTGTLSRPDDNTHVLELLLRGDDLWNPPQAATHVLAKRPDSNALGAECSGNADDTP